MEIRQHTLAALKEGDWARVKRLDARGDMKRRLLDLGLIEGTRVGCVQKSPFGDPTAYDIRGAVVALRAEDAVQIQVWPCESREEA